MAVRAIAIIFLITTATTAAHKHIKRHHSNFKDDYNVHEYIGQLRSPWPYFGNGNVLLNTAYHSGDDRLPATSFAEVDRNFGYLRNSYGVNINHLAGWPIHGCKKPNGLLPYPREEVFNRIPVNTLFGQIPYFNGYEYTINHGGNHIRGLPQEYKHLFPLDRIGAIGHNYNYASPLTHNLPPTAIHPINYLGLHLIPNAGKVIGKNPFTGSYWG